MKPWEETWRWNGLHPLDVFGPDGGDLLFEGAVIRNDSDGPERAKLAAAAPEMARLLLELEWADPRNHWSDDGANSNGCCVCGEYKKDGHKPDCALVAVLRKAGVLP